MPIPVYANFHLIVNPGPLGREFTGKTDQIVHQKPLVGGFLDRVARRTYESMMRDPVFTGLLRAQEGGSFSPFLANRSFMSRYLSRMHLGYVLVETRQAPPVVLEAVKRWPLRLIDEEGALRLYAVEPSQCLGK